jgi:hypothetical protein
MIPMSIAIPLIFLLWLRDHRKENWSKMVPGNLTLHILHLVGMKTRTSRRRALLASFYTAQRKITLRGSSSLMKDSSSQSYFSMAGKGHMVPVQVDQGQAAARKIESWVRIWFGVMTGVRVYYRICHMQQLKRYH